MSFRQSHLRGNLCPHMDIPGDKSISHRALFFSALATGNTLIEGLNPGDDVSHTRMALEAFGVRIEDAGTRNVLVHGLGGSPLKQPKNPLYLGNSGSSARMLTGFAAPHPLTTTFYGDGSLSQRPMRRVTLPLLELGATFDLNHDDLLPMTVHGTGSPKPMTYRMPIPSAQIKTAIILAAMNTPGVTTIIEPIRTRDHTERLMSYLEIPICIDVDAEDVQTLRIQGQHRYLSKPMSIPADPSSAAFFVVAALITPHSNITLKGINWSPYRNRIFEILIEMGANITVSNVRTVCGEPLADLEVSASSLNNITLEANESAALIDEYPILAVAAAQARGVSVFKGLRELRYKESNRLEAIHRNMNLCGIETQVDDDTLVIQGNGGAPIFGGVTINASRDHRIAMSSYVMGMVARNPIIIQGADCIGSSFPNFLNVFNRLSFMNAA